MKPARDPVTGCAHARVYRGIVNEFIPYIGCSVCGCEVPEGVPLNSVHYCYSCGETFDHSDDEIEYEAPRLPSEE